ncbi:MAG: adenylate cyclase [Parvicellaceae bacterium]|jgi:adenylate cyclase
MKEEKTRRLTVIMFTDIVGYTLLMQQDEQAAVRARTLHRQVFNEQHKQHNGEILQYFGDGTLSVFQSVVEAVECAINIQQEFGEGESVPIRIGLHLGDIVFDGTEVYGDGVNIASRIESMGIAGGILLSNAVNDELKNQKQISTKTLGHFELKNITHPVEIFSVTNDGIKIPIRSELKGKYKKAGKSIAVLPFISMSPNKDDAYFSDGMTEEIINALAKIKELKVTSRTSSFYFKDKNIPIPQIGQELNVSTILEGSIRLSENKVRITAQLIDVRDDFHFWSETFDRSMDDIFAVQDEVSLLIADKLREHIGHFEIGDHLVDAPDVPVEVYKRYLKGRYHIYKMDKPNLEKGISILEEIIMEQPNFALTYLMIHQGHTLLGAFGLVPAHEAFATAQPFQDKAIQLNPNLPECQLNLSHICFLQKWDLNGTYLHLNKSFEIRPTVDYYHTMALALIAEGKFTAATNHADTALQLDPISSVTYNLKGFIYYEEEKCEKAIEWFNKSLNLNPGFMLSTQYLGQTLLLMGRTKEGLAFFQNLPADESGDLVKLGGTTLSFAALGDSVRTKAGITKLEAHLETDQAERALNFLILTQTIQGNQYTAIQLIEQGLANRLPMMVYLSIEPFLKPLRSLPRFQKLMRQVLGEKTTFGLAKRKYKQSLLDKDLLEIYQQKLAILMSEKKPYLDPNLTLRSLANTLEVPSNQLSQVLNEGFDKNFSEYVNSHRLEAFKAKAADPEQQHLTILSLAYESGFNSKTVFNTFFKKIEGKTPKAYWKEVIRYPSQDRN